MAGELRAAKGMKITIEWDDGFRHVLDRQPDDSWDLTVSDGTEDALTPTEVLENYPPPRVMGFVSNVLGTTEIDPDFL